MSRFILLAGVAGLYAAGCSSPDDGGVEDPPSAPPPGFLNGTLGQGGAPGQQVGQAGTGTDAPVTPTAGTGGSAPVSAGAGGSAIATAGTGGTTGAAGAPAGGEIPIGTGLAVVPQPDGWVPGTSNGLGIQGAFFATSDAVSDAGTPSGTGSTITLDTTTTPATLCVSGNLPVIPPDPTGTEGPFLYSTHWGGLLGLNLRQVLPAGGGMAQDASPWPRATPAGTVAGFSYSITANGGAALPHLRFTVDFVGQSGDPYCADNVQTTTQTMFSQVTQGCWAAGGQALPAADLLTIQWSIIPSETVATPFNFCVSNIQAIIQ